MTAPHLGGAYPVGDGNTFMPDVYGYLTVKYELKTVIDIGCGYGHTLKWFGETLVAGTGIDGWDEAIRDSVYGGEKILHDFTIGPAPLGDRKFDLAWSSEFLEHVEEKYIPHYMDAFRRCRVAVVTHAEPGQHGHHHVNCKDDQYWIDVFKSYGFKYNDEETLLLRKTDRWKAPWGRKTLLSFNNVA